MSSPITAAILSCSPAVDSCFTIPSIYTNTPATNKKFHLKSRAIARTRPHPDSQAIEIPHLERGVLPLLVELVGEVAQHGARDDGERVGGHRRRNRGSRSPPLERLDRRRSPHRPAAPRSHTAPDDRGVTLTPGGGGRGDAET